MCRVSSAGSLVVVGTGINTFAQCTLEARAYIEQAERLIVHVPDPLGYSWLKSLQPELMDLQDCYHQTSNRADAYELMTQRIVDTVLAGHQTVAVFYGHPGVFVQPSHEAIRRLQAHGVRAEMLPGISAESCLVADLGFDPGRSGCTQHEASSFLFYDVPVDASTPLILWQIGVLGDHTLSKLSTTTTALLALTEKLQRQFPASHLVAIYEAASYAFAKPRIEWCRVDSLPNQHYTAASTLFVPACRRAAPDHVSIEKLGLSSELVFSPATTITNKERI